MSDTLDDRWQHGSDLAAAEARVGRSVLLLGPVACGKSEVKKGTADQLSDEEYSRVVCWNDVYAEIPPQATPVSYVLIQPDGSCSLHRDFPAHEPAAQQQLVRRVVHRGWLS